MALFKFVIPVTVTVNLREPGEVDTETGAMFKDAAEQEEAAWDWAETSRDGLELYAPEDFIEMEAGDPEVVK